MKDGHESYGVGGGVLATSQVIPLLVRRSFSYTGFTFRNVHLLFVLFLILPIPGHRHISYDILQFWTTLYVL